MDPVFAQHDSPTPQSDPLETIKTMVKEAKLEVEVASKDLWEAVERVNNLNQQEYQILSSSSTRQTPTEISPNPQVAEIQKETKLAMREVKAKRAQSTLAADKLSSLTTELDKLLRPAMPDQAQTVDPVALHARILALKKSTQAAQQQHQTKSLQRSTAILPIYHNKDNNGNNNKPQQQQQQQSILTDGEIKQLEGQFDHIRAKIPHVEGELSQLAEKVGALKRGMDDSGDVGNGAGVEVKERVENSTLVAAQLDFKKKLEELRSLKKQGAELSKAIKVGSDSDGGKRGVGGNKGPGGVGAAGSGNNRHNNRQNSNKMTEKGRQNNNNNNNNTLRNNNNSGNNNNNKDSSNVGPNNKPTALSLTSQPFLPPSLRPDHPDPNSSQSEPTTASSTTDTTTATTTTTDSETTSTPLAAPSGPDQQQQQEGSNIGFTTTQQFSDPSPTTMFPPGSYPHNMYPPIGTAGIDQYGQYFMYPSVPTPFYQ